MGIITDHALAFTHLAYVFLLIILLIFARNTYRTLRQINERL